MSWFNRCIVFCGVGFGSGLAPKAPGTFGSAFALLFIPIWLSLGFNLSLIAIIIMSLWVFIFAVKQQGYRRTR